VDRATANKDKATEQSSLLVFCRADGHAQIGPSCRGNRTYRRRNASDAGVIAQLQVRQTVA